MKKLLIMTFAFILCAIVFPHLFASAQDQNLPSPDQVARQEKDLAKNFRKHERLKLYPAEVADQVRNNRPISIYTATASFDLVLEPHDMRARNYRAVETGADGVERLVKMGPVRTYKGAVIGRDDAQARFTIDDRTVEGLIVTPEERYMVEPVAKYSAGADAADFVLYKSSDVIEGSSLACGVMTDEVINPALEGVSTQAHEAQAPDAVAALREIELATEADYEYYLSKGSSAAANQEILSIMNQIEGVYQTELNLTFKITYQGTWTANNDPYVSSNRETQLNEFTNWWNANRTTVKRDLAHLWTGKNVGGGLAWTGVACSLPNYSYGLSQGITWVPQKYALTAHEIGHNLNASHIEDGACANTVMNSSVGPNTALSFCATSRNQIASYVNTKGSCLTTAPACAYTISPTTKSFPPAGGSDRVSITTGCAWSAKSNVQWITITTAASGTGSGALSYTVAANATTAARTGTMTIAGKTFTVTQNGQTLTISGKITIANTTTALAGVTVKLTGTRVLTKTTGRLGSFPFTGLPAGNYTVKPTKLGYLFTPAYYSYPNLSANQTANFTATARTFTITAQATLNSVAMAGVTMKLTGSRTLTCATGSNGTCQFPNLPAGGSYTVTPSKTAFTFTPPSRTYSYLTKNPTASFAASPVIGSHGSMIDETLARSNQTEALTALLLWRSIPSTIDATVRPASFMFDNPAARNNNTLRHSQSLANFMP